MPPRISFVLAVCLAAVPGLAHAQAPAPAPPPLREGSAEFAFVGTSGNSSTQTIGVGGEFIYRPAPWETRLKTTYVRNESDEQLKAEAFVLTFRGQRIIRPRLSGFAQYGYQRDRFAGILDRNTIDVGVAYSWIEQAPHKLVVDASIGYANEQRVLGSNLSTGTFGGGALYTLKLSPTSDLSEDAHIVGSLSQGSDWRFANAISLTAKITTVFSLKVSNTLRYVNFPVVGFKSTDSITSVALVAKF